MPSPLKMSFPVGDVDTHLHVSSLASVSKTTSRLVRPSVFTQLTVVPYTQQTRETMLHATSLTTSCIQTMRGFQQNFTILPFNGHLFSGEIGSVVSFYPVADPCQVTFSIRPIRVAYSWPLCEIMTSSTKPEVHEILHCCQGRTESRPPATCLENLVNFGHVVFEISDQLDRHTGIYRHIAMSCTRTASEVEIMLCM